jgi:hypothetical protein
MVQRHGGHDSMTTQKQLVSEGTAKIDNAVPYMYNTFLKTFIDILQQNMGTTKNIPTP